MRSTSSTCARDGERNLDGRVGGKDEDGARGHEGGSSVRAAHELEEDGDRG